MPRLVNPGTAASSSPALPKYQPPDCPLSDSARRALGELSHNRGTVPYETQLKESARFLGLSVAGLHGRLSAQRERLDLLRNLRREKGTDKTAEEDRLEAHLSGFETEVDDLTRQSEQAIRHVIDMKVELEDESAVLGDLYTTAATRSIDHAAQRSQANAEGQDEAPEQKVEPVASTLDALREFRAQKFDEYNRLGPYQRYALNNDYAGFKKLWHDAAAGADGPPLADASQWFRSDGQPVMDRPGTEGNSDDLAVEREVLSVNCPLTLRPMNEPYINMNCKHTFEKSAILDYLPPRGEVQCPQSGCSQNISKARFAEDFSLDTAMLRRRVHRDEQAQRHEDEDEDEDEDEGEGA